MVLGIICLMVLCAVGGAVAGYSHGWYDGGQDATDNPDDWGPGGSKGRKSNV